MWSVVERVRLVWSVLAPVRLWMTDRWYGRALVAAAMMVITVALWPEGSPPLFYGSGVSETFYLCDDDKSVAISKVWAGRRARGWPKIYMSDSNTETP